MIQNFNIDLSDYDDDKLWIDRRIIRGFDRKGKDVKICKLNITDDLRYEHKFYSPLPKNENLMTYSEMYKFHENDILGKEQESIQVISQMVKKYPNHSLKLSTSFGKDSILTEHLLKKAMKDNFKNVDTVFYNTTMDTPFNYKEAKSRNVPIITPKDASGKYKSFYNMVKINAVPHRTYRWCCSEFKENNAIKYFKNIDNIMFFLGMRNDESQTRKNYEFDKEDDRFNKTWRFILPIRRWTEIELWLYTIHNNLFINQKYKQGYKRCGCLVVCPFATKSDWILDKYWYKYARDRYEKIIKEDFINNEKWCIHNCSVTDYINGVWTSGKIFELTDEVVNEFMEYKGITDKTIAQQYFNKLCDNCGKKVYRKNEIAMNLKYFGRQINNFKCKKCLMKEFNWNKEDWNNEVERFKGQGCTLF